MTDRVAWITDRVRARAGSCPAVFVDAPGVGLPVVHPLREQVRAGEVVVVYFTYGNRRTETAEGNQLRISLGKAYLVSRLQALLQVDENATETSGASRVGTHDDLVTALGLAVQE